MILPSLARIDILNSVITGVMTGIIAWRLAIFLGHRHLAGWSARWLIIAIPVLWIAGVQLGLILGQWVGFFNSFGRFCVIGFSNAAVDFGILNALIYWSGTSSGVKFSIFKATSFAIAFVHSFFWNKYWTFNAASSGRGRTEFAEFLLVALIAMVVNVGVASFVNRTQPKWGTNRNVWANIAAVVGSATALIFSFIGFRVVVFK
jgi:putative flippase GtrA